jgi:VanZ family protein
MNDKPWQRRGSTLARQALGLYAALIVYASLYPFWRWRSLGLGPLDYLFDPLPRYLSVFDIVTNVLGYMPLGGLAVLAVYPRWRGATAAGLAVGLGALLSGSMEAIQTYLPTRVASNLDLAANVLGALIGAALTAPAASALLDHGWPRRVRGLWFERDGTSALALVALWPFATMFPAPYLFGVGDWPSALWRHFDSQTQTALLAWLPSAWHVRAWPVWTASSSQQLLGLPGGMWGSAVTALNLFAALTLLSLPMRARAPRVRMLLGFVALTLFVKSGAAFLQSHAGLTFDWATRGALAGVLCGTAAALAALLLRWCWRALCAALALIVALMLVNVLPADPYFAIVLADWRQGRYLHFNGLARWLAWVWPYVALIWLAWRAEHAWLARRKG